MDSVGGKYIVKKKGKSKMKLGSPVRHTHGPNDVEKSKEDGASPPPYSVVYLCVGYVYVPPLSHPLLFLGKKKYRAGPVP